MKEQVLYNFMPNSSSTAVEIISDLAVFFANKGEFEFSEMLFDVLSDAMSNKIKQDIFKEVNPVKIENDEFTHEQISESMRKAIDDPTQKHQTSPRHKYPPPPPPTVNKIKSDEFLVNENFVESKEFLINAMTKDNPYLSESYIQTLKDENSIRRLALFFYKNKKDKLASELIDIADKYDER